MVTAHQDNGVNAQSVGGRERRCPARLHDEATPGIGRCVCALRSGAQGVDRLKGRGRADDTEDVIRNRFKVYRDETAPLLEFYGSDVTSINAVGEVAGVHGRVMDALGVDGK